MRLALLIVLLLECWSIQAATWYVRPSVHTNLSNEAPHNHPVAQAGIYGTQDGTSYTNAWNGLQSVVWGESGVVNGDTLYICGTHLYYTWSENYIYYQAYIEISPLASGCTIRMDHEDSGVLFGGALDQSKAITWYGPDANSVYHSTNFYSTKYYPRFEVDGSNVVVLNTTNVETWGPTGYWSRVGNSNYVKTATGNPPTTNTIALNAYGWRLALPVGLSNVTFQACEFVANSIVPLGTVYPPGYPEENCLAHHITFKDCTWREMSFDGENSYILINPTTGNDYRVFDGCELYNGMSGIYTSGGYRDGTNQLRGVVGLTVTNCYIHDMDTANYPAIDGHGIGLYFGSNCKFVNNRIERTGTAIALYTEGSRKLTNNLISGNFIKDVRWHTTAGADTLGQGIWVSSQTTNTTVGTRIYNNIILNAGIPGVGDYSSDCGAAIYSSSPDHIDIWNNTIRGANYGIYMAVNSYPPSASIQNNIISLVTNELVRVGNQSATNVLCDYNLFFTNTPPATPFYFAGDIVHDANSVYADPQFVSATPSAALDFRMQSDSPAINAGTDVGLTRDHFGNLIDGTPDIGAAEWIFPRSLNIGTLRAQNLILR